MKRPLILLVAALLLPASLHSCEGPPPEVPSSEQEGGKEGTPEDNNGEQGPNNTTLTMTLTIGTKTFKATLQDNATARALKGMLPLTLEMSELNGNEKYRYLDSSLPTSASNPGTINTGDIMLYGSSCLVVFYKTFSTSYSYTRIGKIDDPTGLEAALGSGSVKIKFE